MEFTLHRGHEAECERKNIYVETEKKEILCGWWGGGSRRKKRADFELLGGAFGGYTVLEGGLGVKYVIDKRHRRGKACQKKIKS